MDTDEFLVTSTAHGRQAIEIPPLRVSFMSERTHMSRIENRRFSEWHFVASFGGNRVLRSLTIYVTGNYDHLKVVLDSEGPFDDVESNGKVAAVLDPLFPDVKITYFQKGARTPARIAALVQTQDTYLLFCFGIYRGAVRSAALPDEARKTLNIELLT